MINKNEKISNNYHYDGNGHDCRMYRTTCYIADSINKRRNLPIKVRNCFMKALIDAINKKISVVSQYTSRDKSGYELTMSDGSRSPSNMAQKAKQGQKG